jgi:hypothetical protein
MMAHRDDAQDIPISEAKKSSSGVYVFETGDAPGPFQSPPVTETIEFHIPRSPDGWGTLELRLYSGQRFFVPISMKAAKDLKRIGSTLHRRDEYLNKSEEEKS